jgi:hypothetical protein
MFPEIQFQALPAFLVDQLIPLVLLSLARQLVQLVQLVLLLLVDQLIQLVPLRQSLPAHQENPLVLSVQLVPLNLWVLVLQ